MTGLELTARQTRLAASRGATESTRMVGRPLRRDSLRAVASDRPQLTSQSLPEIVPPAISGVAGWCRRLVAEKLQGLRHGRLTLVDASGVSRFGPADAELRGSIQVHDASFYLDVVLGGTLGVGESYVDGKWSTPDLLTLFKLFARDRDAITSVDGGAAGWLAPLRAAAAWFRRNTRAGSRRNILAHYDLGNDFYRLMLDPTMMYSCAVYENPLESLQSASTRKLDLICKKLGLEPGMRVVEIGTGWGGFALHAARQYGAHVTTTTISDAQFEFARARVTEAGLTDRIQVLNKDYRDLDGRFDRLVSIEMIEAVGHQFYDAYFAKCQSLLNERGAMLIQAIVVSDDGYDGHVRSVDFIQKHVFPGSTIPAVSVLASAAARTGDTRLVDLDDITRYYAPTLLQWRKNFWRNIDAVRTLGFDDRFIRTWDYYLAYCAAGFAERYLGNVQLVWAKQHAALPRLRVSPA